MIKATIIKHFNLLILLLSELYRRARKIAERIWFEKHEVERICEAPLDIYEKTFRIDAWLERTRCPTIRKFLEKNFGRGSQTHASPILIAVGEILSHHSSKNDEKGNASSNLGPKKTRKSSSNHQLFNIEDGDKILSSALSELSQQLVRVIEKSKGLKDLTVKTKESLRDTIYRIVCYKSSILIAEKLAAIKYDGELDQHKNKVVSLWNNLIRSDGQVTTTEFSNNKAFPPELTYEISGMDDIVSSRWSHIGFQGEDPGTDFRGMGMLGLIQLEYLSRRPKKMASDLLRRSLNERHNYPFAIVGINLTFNLLNLFKDGSLKHFYFDTGDILFRNNRRSLNLIKTLNDLYVELFLRFDCFWHESEPENIFEFRQLIEEFLGIVKMDLCNRNFGMKFLY